MFFNVKLFVGLLVAIPAVTLAQPVDLLSGTPFISEEPVSSAMITLENTTEITELPAEETETSDQETVVPAPVAATVQVNASYYGKQFNGRKTANGERFNMNALTAAHKKLPFGTRVRVAYQGKSVVVRINDRGPYIKGRDIDLSKAAAERIGLIQKGHGRVAMQIL